MAAAEFSQVLLNWFARFGRQNLPWQHPRTPYRVWVSEIMLQQTQVATVIPYFERFMAVFPDVQTLATADTEAVLSIWAGLGYYQRARNLQIASKELTLLEDFPKTQADWQKLPGIGRSTAAAIVAQSFGEKAAILDANVKRILRRFYALPTAKDNALWSLAEKLLPDHNLAEYTQAMMDLGAMICRPKRPTCLSCPVVVACQAYQQGLVDQIPAAKSKALRPERYALLLLLYYQGQWLLEKRPPAGIWSSLWSFPLLFFKSFQNVEEEKILLDTWFRAQHMQTMEASVLPEIRHDFTHFRLFIKPLCFTVASPMTAPETALQWFCSSAWPAALPSPIAKLTKTLSKNFA